MFTAVWNKWTIPASFTRFFGLKNATRWFSPLTQIIADTIKASGPIPVSEYMQYALYHPIHGYYAANKNGQQKGFIGHDGDFITSPEVSQLFGEMLGIFFVLQSERIPKHIPIHIIELGPGNGTLLFDILKVTILHCLYIQRVFHSYLFTRPFHFSQKYNKEYL